MKELIEKIGKRKSVLLGTEVLAFLMTFGYGIASTKQAFPLALGLIALIGVLTVVLVRENKFKSDQSTTADDIAQAVFDQFEFRAGISSQALIERVMQLLPRDENIELFQVKDAIEAALNEVEEVKVKRIRKVAGK